MRQKHSSAAVAFQTEFVQGVAVEQKSIGKKTGKGISKESLSAANEK
jgi:hypothetical protein